MSSRNASDKGLCPGGTIHTVGNSNGNLANAAPVHGSQAGDSRIRVAILSFLFNWPSTGGGIVHTVELAEFLGRAGFQVRHFYPRYLAWGVGRVAQTVNFDSHALDFDERSFQAETIQARFREAVDSFDPDYVIITDSWNFKPLLAEAVRGYTYLLRLQASECLCPLNNLRFLPSGKQCASHQLADADRCRRCVEQWSQNSGALHRAERALAGVGTPRYEETLRRAFAEAEAVLVVNELAAAMIGPYARSVRVVTSGFDAARFPWGVHRRPRERRHGAKLQLFMAGIVEDGIKGFHVLDDACQRLWRTRRDFELVATGDPPGRVNDYTRYVGWLSQDKLPAQLHQADIVVVPTVAQDALGRTAVEGMAAGRPVVASRLGGLPFTVADGAGLLFEPGDPEDLAAKLRLLLDDGRLRRTMGALGRRRFEEHFTWEAIIEKHYRPLLTQRRKPADGAPPRNGAGSHVPTASNGELPSHSAGKQCATLAPSVNGRAARIRRVALVYDDEVRPETTGIYCRRALKKLVEVEFFRPSQLDTIPRGKFDLVLNIDDGLRYRLPNDLRPSAWWCIDTHIDFDWSLQKAQDFDFVFAAQRDGTERLRQNGIKSAHWLPLACDAEIHGPVECGVPPLPLGEGWGEGGVQLDGSSIPKKFDICFIGNLIPGPRADLVRLIQQYFKNVYVGQAYFEEMARIYSASRIVFNRSVANDVNMRVFEALASGSLLMTNDLADNAQADLFRDGVHLATYHDGHELLDKLRFYLRRADIREQIAAAGRQEVLARHTYRHRMQELLATVEATRVGDRAYSSPHAPREVSRAAETVPPAPQLREPASHAFRNPAHDAAYYNHVRPELLALVPHTARRILDIGCGAGRLGAALKSRQVCHVTGIELDRRAAGAAQACLDLVVCGDIESAELDFEPHGFDCVVCGDVLEHLRSPESLLRRLHQWLTPDGCLVASIPNVAHRSVIGNLLRGDWEYEPAGLLDATHMRFFTRRSLERLLYRSRFNTQRIEIVGGEGYDAWMRGGQPGEVEIGPVRAQGLPREQAEELHAYQYLIVARPVAAADYGLTSIVIVTHNAWQYTARCLESIRFRTDEPYELILVDNGSTDGTPERLREMPDVKLIANEANRGFPAAVNQGIAAAAGRQVLLLNNDVIVTTGWLRRMLEAMEKAEGRRQKAEENTSDTAPHALLSLALGQGASSTSIGNALSRRAGIPPVLDLEADGQCKMQNAKCKVQNDASGSKLGSEEPNPKTQDLKPKTFSANPKSAVAELVRVPANEATSPNSHESAVGRVGFVGPLTNCASGYQQIDAPYANLDGLDSFAWKHGKRHQGQVAEVARLIGFCLLIRREVIDQIGLFDERFGIGNFEDDDFCRRALDAGWRLIVAQDAYIHHFGHRSFDAAQIDLNALLDRNKQLYDEKWLAEKGSGARVQDSAETSVVRARLSVATNDGQLTKDNRQSKIKNPKSLHPSSFIPLSLCMIVRDNERTIRAALESIRPWVDEMIVIDTGSTDATPDICRELGAQVYHFPWPDSFSIARNESLKHARGAWIFWMDSDDIIDADNGRQLRDLVAELVRVPGEGAFLPLPPGEGRGEGGSNTSVGNALSRRAGIPPVEDLEADGQCKMQNAKCKTQNGAGEGNLDPEKLNPKTQNLRPKTFSPNPKSPIGYVIQVRCPGPGEDGGHNVTVVDHLKLFRNLPELRFEGRIHEQVLPSIRRLGGEVQFTDIFVVHAGADHNPATRRAKLNRDFHLLKLELHDQPGHPFTLFNLGMTYADAGRHRRAILFLRQSLAKSDPSQSQVRKTYALLAASWLQIDKPRISRRTCRKGLKLFPDDPELLFRLGLAAHRLGRLDEAAGAYRAVFNGNAERHFSSIDRAICGFKTRQNLAVVYTELGDYTRAEEQWQAIIADVPDYRDGWLGLFDNLLGQGKVGGAADVIERLRTQNSRCESLRAVLLIAGARLAEAHGDLPGALAAASAAVREHPTDAVARELWCRLLFQHGDPRETEKALREFIQLDPGNAAALHNLGVACLQQSDWQGAIAAFESSLHRRPLARPTRDSLAYARQKLSQAEVRAPQEPCAGAAR